MVLDGWWYFSIKELRSTLTQGIQMTPSQECSQEKLCYTRVSQNYITHLFMYKMKQILKYNR